MRQPPKQLPDPVKVAYMEPVFFPCGVADPGGRAGYVGDSDGIVAVDLRAGEPLWRTEREAEPLISDGRRLAAASAQGLRPNVLEVMVHDGARGGEVVLVSEPVVFPEWATVGKQGRGTFWISAQLDDSRLRLEWMARARYGGGAPPSARIRREAAHDEGGAVEVDLETGDVELLSTNDAGALAGVRRPPLGTDDLDEPWMAGELVARLAWQVDDDEQILELEIMDPSTTDIRAAVELARGERLVAQVTADGCYLLVYTEPRSGRPAWSVFSSQTGEPVATLIHDAGAHSPAILGNRAFYLVDQYEEATMRQTLRARELQGGALVWELPLAARRRSIVHRLRE
jgi:hypothetical protein